MACTIGLPITLPYLALRTSEPDRSHKFEEVDVLANKAERLLVNMKILKPQADDAQH